MGVRVCVGVGRVGARIGFFSIGLLTSYKRLSVGKISEGPEGSIYV